MATRLFEGAGGPADHGARIEALKSAAIRAVQSGDTATAISSFEQLLAFDPRNADILSNLGKLCYSSGDLEAAIKWFANACAAAPHNQGLRTNYLSALVIAAGQHSSGGNIPVAITCLRTALAEDPGHSSARIDLANLLELSGVRAALDDFMPGATPAQLGTHVLIACMPKSGSSFLKEVLCRLTGWPDTPLSYAYLQNEQELYLPYLLRAASSDTVTQQHCRATGPNTQILQAFGIRPIVLLRRIEDIVVSLTDFYDHGATLNTFFPDLWPTLGQAAKYDLVIDHVMPWYASFYASWERAARRGRLECLFVTYEEMIADKPATTARIAGFLGLDKTAEECAAAVRAADGDTVKTRFNRGGAGRGEEALDDDQKARLRRLFSTYGTLDLGRVGLAG
jgi:tetratricopeptide (TPR) repeat protein